MRIGYNFTNFDQLDEYLTLCPTEVIQIFTHNTKPFTRIVSDEQFARIAGLTVYVHSTFNTIMDQYLARNIFSQQIALCDKFGVKGIVLHIPNRPVDQLIAGFKCISGSSSKTILYLEHVPGIYGESIDLVYELYKGLSEKYKQYTFGICVDTCHMFSSGIDLSSRSQVIPLISKLKSYKVPILIHLNDSDGEYGSLIDRHAVIGKRIWSDETYALKLFLDQPWDAIIELKKLDDIKSSFDFIKKI